MTKTVKTTVATSEVWFEEGDPSHVFYKPFKGTELEIDLTRFQFKGPLEAAELIAKILAQHAYDALALCNFCPTPRHGALPK